MIKRYEVLILNDEYSVVVVLGSLKELNEYGSKYVNDTVNVTGRGLTLLTLESGHSKPPLILVDSDLPASVALATLAHEAVHAVDDVIGYTGIKDSSGEFMAYSVGAIMRVVGGRIMKKYETKKK